MSTTESCLAASVDPRISETVKRFWGYDTLRPLQAQAIAAGIEHRDSLVVLPTGGGKSLCYQVPPAIAQRTDIVVSPLISLMKDQVDGLMANGYPAAALHSGLTDQERRAVEQGINQKKYRLIFVAPERLLTPYFLQTIQRLDVKAFAIDEAHCISQWGHDFRPEYRQLKTLKQRFPGASIHAYTATATPRVRQDIVAQLQLADPNVLVGTFDRPNLTYRIVPKVNLDEQVLEVTRRHRNEAVIVYCISRKDTESMAGTLQAFGIKAAAYHAGMEKDQRRKVQEEFADERLDVVVATVAFGMGIDRSNVRCVAHAAMPKTVEHYQQETGRAGRDGLEAECIMFYSVQDLIRWDKLITFSAEKIEDPALYESTIQAQRELLDHMKRLCSSVRCRHGSLSRYFGQEYDKPDCGACDVCLREIESMPDGTITAQKILSCVARLQERFGVGHLIDVLTGSDTEMIRSFGHGTLSTYGLLRDMPKKSLQNLVYQLIDQDLLARELDAGGRPILKLNDGARAVLKGHQQVRLIEPKSAKVKKAIAEELSWENVDRGLFESLRELRRREAAQRNIAPFIVFGDATLREMAAVRPGSEQSFISIRGIGQRKAADYASQFVAHITDYCQRNNLQLDAQTGSRPRSVMKPPSERSGMTRPAASELFGRNASISEVAQKFGVSDSTAIKYLCEHITACKPRSVSAWVDDSTYRRIAAAATKSEDGRLKPIFEALNGEVPYDKIRIVVAHLQVEPAEP
ncbi:MAG: DNA helicase RecQ [Phycisphaerales bacterium]|nr:DNA helicase RecQ [Phycisphaerales bacterium]